MYIHEWIGNDANNLTCDIYIIMSLMMNNKVEYIRTFQIIKLLFDIIGQLHHLIFHWMSCWIWTYN